MRNLFPGYYKPTESEITDLWANCVFVVDTNVLLNLYRYSEPLREDLLEILEMLSQNGSLWIPYQVALEYQRRRLDVIVEQKGAYKLIIDNLQQYTDQIKRDIKQFQARHRFIDFGDFPEPLVKAMQEIKHVLQEQQKVHPDWFVDDPIRERLDQILAEKIGQPLSQAILTQIPQEAEQRKLSNRPPGFRDMGKAQNPYGDLIIWHQILEYAKQENQPIILVTGDRKDDWWNIENNDIQPHRELIQEIFDVAHVRFYMYQPDTFLEEAKSKLGLSIADEDLQEAVQEIRDVRDRQKSVQSLADFAIAGQQAVESIERNAALAQQLAAYSGQDQISTRVAADLAHFGQQAVASVERNAALAQQLAAYSGQDQISTRVATDLAHFGQQAIASIERSAALAQQLAAYSGQDQISTQAAANIARIEQQATVSIEHSIALAKQFASFGGQDQIVAQAAANFACIEQQVTTVGGYSQSKTPIDKPDEVQAANQDEELSSDG